MLKALMRLCAAFVLCVLLVYAPEIYTAVSAPYAPTVSQRVLLRISLCTQDSASADAFFDALTIYMKESPTVHLRITRADAQKLFSLPDPQPDVFIFSGTLAYDAQRFIPVSDAKDSAQHITEFIPAQGESLLCGVHRDSSNKDAAFALLACLEAASSRDNSVKYDP